MKASKFIEKVQQGIYDQKLIDIYVDKSLLGTQKERYIKAVEKFIRLYGDKDIEVYSTPGRSEVCGNHTDHQNGEVLAAAINLDMIAIVSKKEGSIKVLSDEYDIPKVQLNDLLMKENEKETSTGLIRGVVAYLDELGYKVGGFDAYMTSDVLQGSGLSSSATFEVMIGTILSGLYNDMTISPVTLAQVGQKSENIYFGKPCGLMDQCACAVGSLIHIDFENKEIPMVEKVDVDFSQFNHSLCILDVNASHADLTDDYASIPTEMKSIAQFFNKEVLGEVDEKDFYENLPELRSVTNDRAVLRAIHLFKENKRVQQAVQSLQNKDFATFKKTIQKSGNSSFQYLQNVYSNFDVYNQAVSLALALSEDILKDQGVCRVHGGGFAGTIQAFVKDDYVTIYKEEIENYFGEGSCHVLKVRKYGSVKIL